MSTDNSTRSDDAQVLTRPAHIEEYANTIKDAEAAQDRNTIEVIKSIFWLCELRVRVEADATKLITAKGAASARRTPNDFFAAAAVAQEFRTLVPERQCSPANVRCAR